MNKADRKEEGNVVDKNKSFYEWKWLKRPLAEVNLLFT